MGIGYKLIGKTSESKLSTLLYLAMGWLIVIAIFPLLKNTSFQELSWLVAGGLFYSFGTIFFGLDIITEKRKVLVITKFGIYLL